MHNQYIPIIYRGIIPSNITINIIGKRYLLQHFCNFTLIYNLFVLIKLGLPLLFHKKHLMFISISIRCLEVWWMLNQINYFHLIPHQLVGVLFSIATVDLVFFYSTFTSQKIRAGSRLRQRYRTERQTALPNKVGEREDEVQDRQQHGNRLCPERFRRWPRIRTQCEYCVLQMSTAASTI